MSSSGAGSALVPSGAGGQYGLAKDRGTRNQETKKGIRSWVNLVKGTLFIPDEYSKTRKGREVPIPAYLMPAIRDLCRNKTPEEPLFAETEVSPDKRDSIASWWNNARKRAGVQCRFHDLRITCATKMAEEGVPEAVAMDILGHDSEVHQVYVKALSLKKKQVEMTRFDLHTNLHTLAHKTTQLDATPCNEVQEASSARFEIVSPIRRLQVVENTPKTERCESG